MKLLLPVLQVVFLYGFFILGQLVRDLFSIPLPASILGLMLMFFALLFKLVPLRFVESGALLLLSYLPLFFIPATAGVVNYFDVFTGKGVFLIVVLIFSTLLTMAGSALTSQYLSRRLEAGKERS